MGHQVDNCFIITYMIIEVSCDIKWITVSLSHI